LIGAWIAPGVHQINSLRRLRRRLMVADGELHQMSIALNSRTHSHYSARATRFRVCQYLGFRVLVHASLLPSHAF